MVQHFLPTAGDCSLLDLSTNSINYPNGSQRKHRQLLVRDSQARLDKVGRPGSKRYQRYLNKSYLYEHEWNLEPEDFEVARKSSSPFSALFDEVNRTKWEPFIDVTEEQQEYLLRKLQDASVSLVEVDEQEDEFGDFVMISSEYKVIPIDEEVKKMTQTQSLPVDFHFQKVDRKIRKFIRKNPNDPFLRSLDCKIVEYIQHTSYQSKTFSFHGSFHRMVCHGICQFYSLHSKSQNISDTRVVVVRKPKSKIAFPSITLSQFLDKGLK